MAEMNLQQLTDKMDRIKSDIAKKEGERNVVWADLSKEFKVKTLDDAYAQLDAMHDKIDVLKEQKEKLMISVRKRLVEYGY